MTCWGKHMKRFGVTDRLVGLIFLVTAAICLAGPATGFAADADDRTGMSPRLNLTSRERAWLESRKTIWIGAMDAWPPMNFLDETGTPSGIGADYIRAMNRLLGGRLQIVPGPFKANLAKTRQGELDAIMDITPKEERRKYLNFTRIYLDIPHVIVGPRQGSYYKSEKDLEGRTVALEEGFYNIKYFRKNYPKVKIREYPNTALALDAIVRGEADAYAGNRAVAAFIMGKEVMASLKFHGRLNKKGSVLAIGVPKDRPFLVTILDKALAAIPKTEIISIRRRWAGLQVTVPKAARTTLTGEELAWLSAHPVIRVHNEKDRPPFNFFENGSPKGLSIDYMTLLAERLGIKVEYVTGPDWNRLMEMVRDGNLDVMLNIVRTRDRKAYLDFTPPYVKNPNVIVSRKAVHYTSVRELIGKTVAVQKGSALAEILSRAFPSIRLSLEKDSLSCLRAVSFGRAEAALGKEAAIRSLMARNMLAGLRISGEVDVAHPDLSNLRIGVRKGLPLLFSALAKAMEDVSPARMDAIRKKWMIREARGRGLDLTSKERAWIRKHPRIKANGGAYAPFILKDADGKMKGISVDILNLAAGQAGLSVDYVDRPWTEIFSFFKAGDLDLLHCVSRTVAREQFMQFTAPYLTISAAIYTKKENKGIESVADLDGKTLAVLKGSQFHETLEAAYPQIRLMPVDSTLEGLKKAGTGAADAFLGNQVVAQAEMETHLIQNLRVAAYWDEFQEDLRFGVQQGETVLAGILKKALTAITEDQKRRIIARYVTSGRPGDRTREAAESVLDYNTLAVSGGLILMVIAGVFFVLIKVVRQERLAANFGSPKFRVMVVIGLSLFILVVAGLGWVLTERTRQAVLKDADAHLKLVLSLIQDRTRMWLEGRNALMRRLGKDRDLVRITEALLKVPPHSKELQASGALADARNFFRFGEDIFDNIGFFIINPDGISIGSMRDENLGTRNLIADQYPDLVTKAFQGVATFVPPMTSDVLLEGAGRQGRHPPTMFFIGPVEDEDGDIIAAMTLRVDPVADLVKLTRSPGRWKTDDVYAFDRLGRMLSPSRFEEQLRGIGLLSPGQTSALTIEVRDPGGDMTTGFRTDASLSDRPLTRMAEHALVLRRQMADLGIDKGFSAIGTDIQGYRDYRGVKVFGAWLWNMDLDLGMAAEIDVDEVMAGFYRIRMTVFAILGGTLVLSVFSVLLVLVLGDRTRRALEKARDGLEEKVAERTLELKENQERFAALLESAPDAMVVSDASGKIVLINSRTEQLLGYRRSELLDAPVEMLVPDAGRSEHPQKRGLFLSDKEVRQRGQAGLELVAQSKSGTLVPVEVSLSPIESRSGILVVASLRDITERKQAENALKASEENFRRILESVGDGIFGVDTEGCVTFVNPSASRMLGFDADELIGHNIHESIHSSHTDGVPYPLENCPMFRSYTMGERAHITDEMLRRKDGTGFDVEYSAVPIVKEGRVAGAVVSFRDITQRRQMEEALRDKFDELDRFMRLAVGREHKMIQLKEEINDLAERLGEIRRYRIVGKEGLASQQPSQQSSQQFSQGREQSDA